MWYLLVTVRLNNNWWNYLENLQSSSPATNGPWGVVDIPWPSTWCLMSRHHRPPPAVPGPPTTTTCHHHRPRHHSHLPCPARQTDLYTLNFQIYFVWPLPSASKHTHINPPPFPSPTLIRFGFYSSSIYLSIYSSSWEFINTVNDYLLVNQLSSAGNYKNTQKSLMHVMCGEEASWRNRDTSSRTTVLRGT